MLLLASVYGYLGLLEWDVDEFRLGDDAIYAVVLLYERDDEEFDEWWRWQKAIYPRRLVPERGRYTPANFDVTVTAAADPTGVERSVGPVESVAEFEAEILEMDGDLPLFALRDGETGSLVGRMWLQPDHLPEAFAAVGDRCHVTVRMEYRHERTVDVLDERLGESEADLERRREAKRELFEEWEEGHL